jgi:maltose-binding protein MalE
MSSIIKGNSPDIFVLNNNEKNSIFSDQIQWIDPKIINPNDFRIKYKTVFANDLIESYLDESTSKNKDFLIWIPVWYETLWVFYNKKYVKPSDLISMYSLNKFIRTLKDENPDIVPIWIWNWTYVYDSSSIVTQFFLNEDSVSSLGDLTSDKSKQALSSYYLFWSDLNDYNSKIPELEMLSRNNLDLFSKYKMAMVVWYPRMIKEIKNKWFSIFPYLQALPFPHNVSGEAKALVEYNYFVVNKDSGNKDLANNILAYLTTQKWASSYLDKFRYYLPSLISLEEDKLEEKIFDKYSIVLKNFLNTKASLFSFDKWIKSFYDKNIVNLLDSNFNYVNNFNSFKSKIICKTNKITLLESLSKNCEN